MNLAKDFVRSDTHPWISFRLDLRKAPRELWMLLGEARSKCEHLGRFPVTPETRLALHQLTLLRGAIATTAIEGNTLTEQEVLDHRSGKRRLPASRLYQAQEVENIVKACNEVVSWVEAASLPPLDSQLIRHFQGLVLSELDLEPGVVPGAFRSDRRVVGNYRAPAPQDVELLMSQLCDWIGGSEFTPSDPRDQLPFAILKAVIGHLYLEWIHPFADGNGRTGRLLEFYIMLSSGIPSSAAHVLSNHYNATRAEYYRQLDSARGSNEAVIGFVLYALEGFVDGLRDQLEHLWSQALHLLWRRYLDDEFRGEKSETVQRQKRLLIDLAEVDEPVPREKLRHITPEVAEAYAAYTQKAVTRDLNALLNRGLVRLDGTGYRANIEILYLSLPAQIDPPIDFPEAT